MTASEIIGLAIGTGLLGGVAGAVLVAVLTAKRSRARDRRTHRMNAYARWLAARLAMSRASVSFVAAFRTLAVEDRDGPYAALRTDEAQRARARWFRAMRALDAAEANLIVWSRDGTIRKTLSRFPRVSAHALRETVNGNEDDADAFVQRLRDVDGLATAFVADETARLDPHARRAALGRRVWSSVAHIFVAGPPRRKEVTGVVPRGDPERRQHI